MTPKQLMKAVADTLKNENCAILIASKDGGTITKCAMVGNSDEVIANLTVALTIALGSIKDPAERLQTKQTVSTAIMTKDIDIDSIGKKWIGDAI